MWVTLAAGIWSCSQTCAAARRWCGSRVPTAIRACGNTSLLERLCSLIEDGEVSIVGEHAVAPATGDLALRRLCLIFIHMRESSAERYFTNARM